MTPRSIRRAAERKALKAARKQENAHPNQLITEEPTQNLPNLEPAPAKIISEAQYAANRANAQQSRGPISTAGKAISARNHTQHGLTIQPGVGFRVIPGEDQSTYDDLAAAFAEEWQPATATEHDLVERLAVHSWLSRRATRLQNELLSEAGGRLIQESCKQFALYHRYYTTHARAFNKAFTDLMRLRTFQMRQRKDEALLQRRTAESEAKIQIRFESQKLKSEAHTLKMELFSLKLEAQKQRNQRNPKPAIVETVTENIDGIANNMAA